MTDSKYIKGYEEIYGIEDNGSVYSYRRSEFSRNKHGPMIRSRGGHPMKTFVGCKGYLMVELSDSKKQRKFYIHRLVYESFVGPLELGKMIHHKDENKQNNHYTNLVQITYKEHSEIHKQLKESKICG